MDWKKLEEKANGCEKDCSCSVLAEMREQSRNWKNGGSKEDLSGKGKVKSKINWKNLREKAEKCRSKKDCPVFVEMERQSRDKRQGIEADRLFHGEKLVGKENLPKLTPLPKPKEDFPQLTPISKSKEILPKLTPVQRSKEVLPQLAPLRKSEEALTKIILPPVGKTSAEINKIQQRKEDVRSKNFETGSFEEKKSQSTQGKTGSRQKNSKEEKFRGYLLGVFVAILCLLIIAGVALFYGEKKKRRLEAEERAKKESEAALVEKIAAVPTWTPIKPLAPVQRSVSSAKTESADQTGEGKGAKKITPLKKVMRANKKRHRKHYNNSDDFSDESAGSGFDEADSVVKSSRWNVIEHAYIQDGNKLFIDYKYRLPWNVKVEVYAKAPDRTQAIRQQVVSSYTVGKRLTINLADSHPRETAFEIRYWQ